VSDAGEVHAAEASAEVTVRTASVDDLPVLRDLYRRSSLSNVEDAAALSTHPELLVLGDDGVRAGWTRVAVDGSGAALGFATAVPAAAYVLELEDLFVDPDAMRRGVGRLLVEDVVDRARQAGVERVEVTGNRAALRFYERMGFVADGEVPTLLAPGIRMHLAVSSAGG
jgi:GNAT superfamily N-acetyltransferase